MPTLLDNLSLRGKLALAAAGVLAVVLVFGIVSLSKRTSYGLLATDLAATESADLTTSLEKKGIPFRTGDNGRTVLVASDRVDEARALLVQENLLGGGRVGWEVFDKTKLGATDFQQRVNYQRALQGEIARAIEQIDGVRAATVNLALPDRKLFAREEKPPTASVLLTLENGYALEAARVRGISRLVSSAVEGLDAQNVVITDNEGTLLSGGSPADQADGGDGGKLAAQEAYERRAEADLNAMLARVVGDGKATAAVSAELNWDRAHVESETWGRKPLALSKSTEKEKYEGAGGAAGGAAGVVGDVPSYAAAAGGKTSGKYDREQTQTQFAIDKTITKRDLAQGALERQSVAVLVDESVPAGRLEAIRSTVEAAMGYDGKRGDRVSVERVPFAGPAEAPAAGKKKGLSPLILQAVAAVAALAFLAAAALGLRRRQRTVLSWPVEAEALPAGLTLSGLAAAPSFDDLAERARQDALAREAASRRQIEERAAETARLKTEESAQLVRTWLNE
ncbi:fliF: flagellar M-ring protein FliF [Gaiella occulta]|uniref:Flagellar M-ring protein n=1 Tax=Gaiella occulta TaxID=1002870 RepID=A0A7M2Z0P3_9ACTN|nr:flagellar basal-body MS-ring/collar protein FliF [Gaiella occulta]RDI75978.1 fliF: flagellar M-ring protein FliF [Gaiella occulta]